MSSPENQSSSERPATDNSSRRDAPPQASGAVAPPLDGVSLMNYEFTFQQHVDDRVTASFRIEADPNGSRLESPDTHSITSSISKYRVENGRTFHAYKDGSYMYPNDEQELDRQDYQYVVLKHVMGGKLYFAPWSQEKPPRNVLDIGTGTGQWCIEMGDEFPSANISGTDLSPVQPRDVPENVHFYVEDSREDWQWYAQNETFDYIHTRMTVGAWQDLKEDILQKSYDRLAPGGWFEAQEIQCTILCDDDTMPDDFELKVHFDDLEDASAAIGRPLKLAHKFKQVMREVGFVDVEEVTYKIPINGWPRNRQYKQLGKMWEHNLITGIHAVSVGPLHRVRGLNQNQIQMMLVPVRTAISDSRVHAYHKFFIVWGRKPFPNELQTSAQGSGDATMGGAP
ncbi:hypothetical protein JX265_002864 [Neoarthrinium moseri]|uniref:Secondary metabolism regulator LAE1 n=1 Tax=Neoarthrinium moseri TaxID=1658444 RepID=A0A9P9WSU7_9PEZI|nr:uncharacterized protein JN550_008058 [Neoarthrinium moseri]KAI1865800.1 hypothetical protein JN550_008058 [Neoarthrinium moseri]KAI1878687.1 hypothetical protein JX265_002864 [Neoarthrinium moseri]